MTHEAKTKDRKEVDKIIDDVIAENKGLIDRLKEEDQHFQEIPQSVSSEDSLVECVEVLLIQPISETSTAETEYSTVEGEYHTDSSKKNKVELTAV